MFICICVNFISFHNDKATLRGVRGKYQWQTNNKFYKCNLVLVLKHEEKYYVARDEGVEVEDISEDENQSEAGIVLTLGSATIAAKAHTPVAFDWIPVLPRTISSKRHRTEA
jgi:hypothetical protein